MEAWIALDEDYWMRTHYYCKPCHRERYDYPKQQSKWDNEPYLACGQQLLNEEMWNNIPGQGGMCNTSCQYTILITTWHQAISCLEVESASPSEILEIKNNLSEPTNIVLVLNLDAFLNLENSPEEFYQHYQNLAPTRKEQEQRLEEINT
ncbi:hypothetical protein G9A89_005239 [Geosiphon pyriformis]|nr:hypothetical protein G9A89_005239 [Geosiphon pyriformis]